MPTTIAGLLALHFNYSDISSRIILRSHCIPALSLTGAHYERAKFRKLIHRVRSYIAARSSPPLCTLRTPFFTSPLLLVSRHFCPAGHYARVMGDVRFTRIRRHTN